MKLQGFNSIYFWGKCHFEDYGTQNCLVFQLAYKYMKTVASTPCLGTPVRTAELTVENLKCFGQRLRSRFLIDETKKPIGDDTKVQQCELKNILR